jgi:hypothetical protein
MMKRTLLPSLLNFLFIYSLSQSFEIGNTLQQNWSQLFKSSWRGLVIQIGNLTGRRKAMKFSPWKQKYEIIAKEGNKNLFF